MDTTYIISTTGTFILSLIIFIFFINRNRTETGRYVGLIPIIANGLWYIVPPLTCHSDYPLACEWSGIWVFFICVITICLLITYSLFVRGIKNNHSAAYLRYKTGEFSVWQSFSISFKTIAILLLFAMVSGGVVKIGYDLFNIGVFTTWRYLGKPPDLGKRPGEKAINILSYNLRSVQIETNQGRTFKTDLEICSFLHRRTSNCWYLGTIKPGILSPKDEDCKVNVPEPYFFGHVIERVEASSCSAPSEVRSIFVLLSDGRVFVWHHKAHLDIYTFLFFFAPGVLGGMAFGVSLTNRYQKKIEQYLFGSKSPKHKNKSFD